MQALASCLQAAGLKEICTYIQSGNIAFDSSASCRKLEGLIWRSLHEKFGFDVSVMVRDKAFWSQLIEENPFCESGDPTCDINELHVTLLGKKPAKEPIRSLAEIQLSGDELHLIGDRVYLRIVNGYSKTKLTNGAIEKKLGVAATSRNWKTICKLADL